MSDDADFQAYPGPFPGPEPDAMEPGHAAEPTGDSVPEDALDALPDTAAPAGAESHAEPGDDQAPPEQAQTAHSPATTTPPGARPIAPKEYYSISEVCELVGLKPHVLRYWESQFPVLNPSKNRSGNRVYQRKEIKLILLVQHLLYKEKYTIEGARQRLDQLRRGGKAGELPQATSHAVDSEIRKLLRDELQQLLEVLAPRAPGRAAE